MFFQGLTVVPVYYETYVNVKVAQCICLYQLKSLTSIPDHWVKKAVPKTGNLLEITGNRDISSFPVVFILWKPLCGFHTWKQSIRRFHLYSLHWKLSGNLTSCFHEFPHLQIVNPIILLVFSHWKFRGNLTGGFHGFPHK